MNKRKSKTIILEDELTAEQKKDNLATFGVEDPREIIIDKENPNVTKMTKEELKNNPPLETPTFFSRQRN